MLPPIVIAGLVLLFAGVIASRILCTRAERALSDEEKPRLNDKTAQVKTFGLISVVLLMMLLFAMVFLPVPMMRPAYFLVCAMLATHIAYQSSQVRRRLVELGLPEAYRATYWRAQWCLRGGLLALFLSVAYLLCK